VTTPVCTHTDTEFGSRLEFANGDPGSVIPVPLVCVPSPVYFSPFSPSPSPSHSSSSLSPAPSIEPVNSPSANTARLSRLLSSTFRDTRVVVSPARPATAHLIYTACSCAHAYRPSSATTTSLYTPPTSSTRLVGTHSRTSFYPGPTDDVRAGWGRVRDTFSTVTISDTDTVCTVPHLLRAVAEAHPSPSPFADPDPGTGTWYVNGNEQSASASPLRRLASTEGQTQVGTSLALKLRLSVTSEHAQYRLRERERKRKRRQERERGCNAEQRMSTDSRASGATAITVVGDGRSEERIQVAGFGEVLREIGW
jgi:hypothetical protein